MRVNESVAISAPREMIWEYLADPGNYLHFMSGITRWEVESEERSGLGARYRMLMRVGSAEVGGLVEVVEFAPQRETGDGRTRVEFRFAYGVAGAGITGYLSERLAKGTIRGHVRRSLHQLK